jgi:hypothetical protein
MSLHVRAPELGLRLVNRQFSSEYDERSPSTSNICLSVTGSTPTTKFPSAAGFSSASRATAVDIHLVFTPYDKTMYKYFRHLSGWLTELVTDMPCIERLHLRLSFTCPPKVKDIDYFSRMTQRNIFLLDRDFVRMQEKRKSTPIALLTKVDMMLIIPKTNPDDAGSTEVETSNFASWTPAGGYQKDVGLAEMRRKYGAEEDWL